MRKQCSSSTSRSISMDRSPFSKLDHQEVMNAVSMDMLGGLGEALDAIDDKRPEVRCLVLTGAGRAFCTGANLQGRNNQKPGKGNAGDRWRSASIRSCGGCASCIARS